MNTLQMINLFSQINPTSTFVGIREYENAFGEVSNFNIILNFSYKNSLLKSKSIIENYKPKMALEYQAKQEMLDSFNKSLNLLNLPEKTYIKFTDSNNNIIDGIKAHRETFDLYMFGLKLHKKIIKPGQYKDVNSAHLTIIKNKLRSLTPLSKFRLFKLTNNNFKSIKLGRFTIT